jgi:hypothetical protein
MNYLSGFYDNGNNVICQACHYSCLSCNGSSLNNCIKCDVSNIVNRLTVSVDK